MVRESMEVFFNCVFNSRPSMNLLRIGIQPFWLVLPKRQCKAGSDGSLFVMVMYVAILTYPESFVNIDTAMKLCAAVRVDSGY